LHDPSGSALKHEESDFYYPSFAIPACLYDEETYHIENDIVNNCERGKNKDSQCALSRHSGVGNKKWKAEDEKSDRFDIFSNICYQKWTLGKVNGMIFSYSQLALILQQ